MNPAIAAQIIHCERANDVDGESAVIFLSVIQRDAGGQLLRCESHVFCESTESHTQDIVFRFNDHRADQEVLREAIAQTHQLFATTRKRTHPGASAELHYRTRILDVLPIEAWRHAGKFAAALARLPDLTAATVLQTAALKSNSTAANGRAASTAPRWRHRR